MLVWEIGKEGNQKAIFSILNGSEPKFDSKRWNDNAKIRKTHNCYAYMLDIISNSINKKPQPGYSAGLPYLSDSDIRSCDKMIGRVSADNPTVIRSTFRKPCPKGFRKGYMAVDPGDNTDYHFYRQDSDGYWSHKPGSTNAKRENFDGEKIIAPHLSRRESNSHVYSKQCGYFCFNPKNSKLSNKPTKKNKNL